MKRSGLVFAGCFGIASLICTGIAVGTTHWFVLRQADEDKNDFKIPESLTEYEYQFTFHMGLWMTCYDNRIPPTVQVPQGNCTVDYDFASRRVEDFSRASIVCIMLSAALAFLGCITGATGFCAAHRGAMFQSGLQFFAAAICTLIGNCTFTARILLQLGETLLPSSVKEEFGWSFFISWASLGLQILAGSIFIGCSRSKKETKDRL